MFTHLIISRSDQIHNVMLTHLIISRCDQIHRAISPKMVETPPEGDKDADLVFTTLWAGPGAWCSFFLQLCSLSLLSWFSSPMEAVPDYRHLPLWWLDGRLNIPLPSCTMPKMTLGHNPKVGGLLHLLGPPRRLQIGHLLTAHMRRIPNKLF